MPYLRAGDASEQVERLEGLGAWIHRHAEAVYDTQVGLPHAYHYGASTLSKDQQTLYLICFDQPNGQVAVKGIRNDIRSISILGEPLTYRKLGGAPWINLPGVLWIDVPEAALDPIATVCSDESEEKMTNSIAHRTTEYQQVVRALLGIA